MGRSNYHDHQIQIQMFIRKKTTEGKLHNQTMRVQSASILSVCVRTAEKILVRLKLQNANLELLISQSPSPHRSLLLALGFKYKSTRKLMVFC